MGKEGGECFFLGTILKSWRKGLFRSCVKFFTGKILHDHIFRLFDFLTTNNSIFYFFFAGKKFGFTGTVFENFHRWDLYFTGISLIIFPGGMHFFTRTV